MCIGGGGGNDANVPPPAPPLPPPPPPPAPPVAPARPAPPPTTVEELDASELRVRVPKPKNQPKGTGQLRIPLESNVSTPGGGSPPGGINT